MAASRKYHPASMIFPLLGEDELQSLADDIARNGLIEEIVLDSEGRIVDGRNRQTACTIAGVTPRYRTLNSKTDALSYVISTNLHRRHLTRGQAAAAAAEAEVLREQESAAAKVRQVATLKQGDKMPVPEIFPERDQGDARDKVGDAFGVSGKYVSDARKIKEESPELFEQVKNKTLTLPDAKKQLAVEQASKKAKAAPWPKREQQLKKLAMSGKAVVANVKSDCHLTSWARDNGLLVMVDRSSEWGNPFIIGDDGDRDAVCDKYASKYLPYKDKLQSRLRGLKGKVLCCHCAPQRCHADAIAEAANATG